MDLERDLVALMDLLEGLRAPHMIVGGLAVEARGVPRTTYDVDVQVDLGAAPPPTDSHFHGWFIHERTRDPVFDQEALVLEGRTSVVPFELFLTAHWFTRQALARRVSLRSERLARDVWLPTAEDLVLLKACFWVAPTRSRRKAAQDGVDVENIVEANRAALDLAYLEENARKLGVWDALRSVL